MRDLTTLDRYRVRNQQVLRHYGSFGDHSCGVFSLPSRSNGRTLTVIASSDGDWEHVSVSLPKKPPSWAEMEQVKRAFFEPHEVVMQLHVAESDHISMHPNCLHLWRPTSAAIPLPPKWMVA